jgi:hypothetical protein
VYAADAFDYLSDLRTEAEWNDSCEVVEKLTDGPIGVGTTYRCCWRSIATRRRTRGGRTAYE